MLNSKKTNNNFKDIRGKVRQFNDKFKYNVKADLKCSIFKLKMMIKDSYMHKFMFGSFAFGAFFMMSLYRKANGIEEHPLFMRFFFAGFLSSVIMLVCRECYIFWFKNVEIPGVPQRVSMRILMKEIYEEFAPDSFRRLMDKINGFCSKAENKYNSSVLGKFVESTDMNYTLWLFLFLLVLL